MTKRILVLMVMAVMVMPFTSLGLVTFNWYDTAGVFDAAQNLYEKDGTTTAAFGSWEYYVYAYDGLASDVASAVLGGATGPLLGSYAVDVTAPTWEDNSSGPGGGYVSPSVPPTVADANGAGIVGWTTYVMFENADDSMVGFIYSDNWTVPDDLSGTPSLTMNLSYDKFLALDPTGPTGGTVGDIVAGDGWAAANAVPEPGTMILFALGMLTMGARMKRKKD